MCVCLSLTPADVASEGQFTTVQCKRNQSRRDRCDPLYHEAKGAQANLCVNNCDSIQTEITHGHGQMDRRLATGRKGWTLIQFFGCARIGTGSPTAAACHIPLSIPWKMTRTPEWSACRLICITSALSNCMCDIHVFVYIPYICDKVPHGNIKRPFWAISALGRAKADSFDFN